MLPSLKVCRAAGNRFCMADIIGIPEHAESVLQPSARVVAPAAPLTHLLSACAAVVAVWLVAACRWIVTDRVVPWDSKNQFYAFFRFLAASLKSGASPFWNPYHYGGHPSVADP